MQNLNFEIDFLKKFEGVRYPTQVRISEEYFTPARKWKVEDGPNSIMLLARGDYDGAFRGKEKRRGNSRITFFSETKYKMHKNPVPYRPLSEITTIYDDYKFLRVNIKEVIYDKK